MNTQINPAVFREYDIRGTVDVDLSVTFARRLGLAYSEFISAQIPLSNRTRLTISVGHDCRLSSPAYAAALISGLTAGGLDVIALGNCPTPAVYFSLFHLDLDGGIMITASHLPADSNGFKICIGHETISGDQIRELRKVMEKNVKSELSTSGFVTEFSILPSYLDHLMKDTKPMKPKKVVIDYGNGNGSQVGALLFKKIGANSIELFNEMDGSFPNHIPDPSRLQNLVDLIETVKKSKADFGIGIDGDADRIGVVDENGRLLYGDELLVIFSREILKKLAGASVVSEVKSSFRLFDDISAHGGRPVMWKTGRSHIEAKMRETNAVLGGEMSGHMFFADKNFGYDDAIYAALRIYEIAAQHEGTFSSLLADLPPSFSTPEIRIRCEELQKFDLVKKTIENLQKNPKIKNAKFTLIDGVRIDFKDGWGLMRASNTEAVLSLRFEATSQIRLTEIRKIFEESIKDSRSLISTTP